MLTRVRSSRASRASPWFEIPGIVHLHPSALCEFLLLEFKMEAGFPSKNLTILLVIRTKDEVLHKGALIDRQPSGR